MTTNNKKTKAGLIIGGSALLLAMASKSSSSSQQQQSAVPAVSVNPYIAINLDFPPIQPHQDDYEFGDESTFGQWEKVGWVKSAIPPSRAGGGFVNPPAEWRTDHGNIRRQWSLFQPPADGNSGFFTKSLSVSNPTDGGVLFGFSTDFGETPSPGLIAGFSWGQTDTMSATAPIDNDNVVLVQTYRDAFGRQIILSTVSGGVQVQTAPIQMDFPRFVAIQKEDATFTAWASPNGFNWRLVGKLNASVQPDRVSFGLASNGAYNEVFGAKCFRYLPNGILL